jgi:protein involved in polysaccharide export with SLBB domain
VYAIREDSAICCTGKGKSSACKALWNNWYIPKSVGWKFPVIKGVNGELSAALVPYLRHQMMATKSNFGSWMGGTHMKLTFFVLAGLLALTANSADGQTAVDPQVANAGPSTGAESVPAATAATTANAGLHERNPRYQLRKGDSFDLDMPFSQEFNQTVSVQPDGYITLKAVGSMFVEGQTVPQLTDTIKTAYAKILHDPVITIALKDFEKPYFIAAGQVGKPGKYDIRSSITITEAVAIAGGFTDKSKHSQVVLYRPVTGGYEAKVVNVKKLLADRNLSEDLQVLPGDLVYVPQNEFSKIRPFLPTASTGVGAYYNPVPF